MIKKENETNLEKHVEGGNQETTQSTEEWLKNKIQICDTADRNQCFFTSTEDETCKSGSHGMEDR